MKGKTFWVLVLALLAGGGVLGWQSYQARLNALPPGFASGNGRVESVQVDVTTKEPGRVEKILVHEGDMVHAGQVVAKMDTVTLKAELREPRRPSPSRRPRAWRSQPTSPRLRASSSWPRSSSNESATSLPARPPRARITTSRILWPRPAALRSTARRPGSTRPGSRSKRPRPRRRTIQSRINDMTLKSTVEGRVLYRLAEEGEVLGSGGKVLTLVNLGDVYMEIYLPAQDAVKTKLGADARIVLDIVPEYAARPR